MRRNNSELTYADVLDMLNSLLNTPHLNAKVALITDPDFDGPFSDFDPKVCALYFGNDILTKLIEDWNKYRNVGDDAELNQNINEMWLERMRKKYSTPILPNKKDLPISKSDNDELPFF